MQLRRTLAAIGVAALAVGLAPGGAAALPGGAVSATADGAGLATPQLIDRAVAGGRISRATGDLYLAWALSPSWRKVPAAYQSDVPWDGTVPALHLRERLAAMPAGAQRSAIGDAFAAGAGVGTFCDTSVAPMLDSVQSDHFFIEYNAASIGGGLTIDSYVTSFETSWTTEVDDFGWAAPPVLPSGPPGDTYHVRIDALGPALYGVTSTLGTYAGDVGDNPSTAWNDGDASASCIVINSDFSTFPGTPQTAMDATTAHEFNHSIQFGYGGLAGGNTPDDVFVEAGATWMEDEVMDAADDSYNYLWPNFAGSMGEYTDAPDDSPYPYWITFRGITERYGAGTPGGGEQVMQDFWEATSKNTGNNLTAMQQAVASKGTTLGLAYHDYAVAARLSRSCGGGYVVPHCFEEGNAYVAAAGANSAHGAIASVPGSAGGSVQDAYALNWIDLPVSTTGAYSLTLENTSTGGKLRASAVCDTGTGLIVSPFPSVANAGQSTTLGHVDTDGCDAAFVAITNEAVTSANPSNTPARSYTLTTGAAAGPGLSIANSSVTEPDTGGRPMGFQVTLSETSDSTVTVRAAASDVTATRGSDYKLPATTLTFPPGTTTLRVKAKVRGDTMPEGDETFTVTLSSPSGASLDDATATGTILDND